MSSGRVAVIDIGSNSIKVLVAAREAGGHIAPLKIRTIDARISAGISHAIPRLGEEGMVHGIEAISSLLADAADFKPAKILLVATSAVRDAQNRTEFAARVHAATGHPIRILTGKEEANFIGRGLACDPALGHLRDFYVFDLGGGSLECLTFHARTIRSVASLPLGCVRLTEKFIADPTQPFSTNEQQSVMAHTRDVLMRGRFDFDLPRDTIAVGTGGTVTTVRAIFGARAGKTFEATSPRVTVDQLRELLTSVGGLPLTARKQIPGLPPARADVFPTALATLIALADAGGLTSFHNSVYNLRYGLAAEALQET